MFEFHNVARGTKTVLMHGPRENERESSWESVRGWRRGSTHASCRITRGILPTMQLESIRRPHWPQWVSDDAYVPQCPGSKQRNEQLLASWTGLREFMDRSPEQPFERYPPSSNHQAKWMRPAKASFLVIYRRLPSYYSFNLCWFTQIQRSIICYRCRDIAVVVGIFVHL